MGLFKTKSKSPMATTTDDGASMRSGSLRSPTSFSNGRDSLHTSNTSASSAVPDIPLPPRPDPDSDPATYLRSIYAVRDRTRPILEVARRNELKHFDVDQSMFRPTASYVVSIIKVCSTTSHSWSDIHSEITPQTTLRSHLTADGSTLKSATGPV